MFHIVFNANQNYMKYTAVLITNIIHYTDKSKSFEDFIQAGAKENLENKTLENINKTESASDIMPKNMASKIENESPLDINKIDKKEENKALLDSGGGGNTTTFTS